MRKAITAALKTLHGEVVQVSVPGMNFNPIGTLGKFDDESGLVVLTRPVGHSVATSDMWLDANDIVAVGHYTGYPKQT